MLKFEHLIGRPFAWGVTDCAALLRQFYLDNYSIELTDYARPTYWDSNTIDIIRAIYEREGFTMIPRDEMKAKDLRVGDIACVAVGSPVPNHFAIYVGDNTIVHHKANTFSSSELFRDFWRNQTSFYLRHPLVPDSTIKYPDVDIGDLIRAGQVFTGR